MISRKKMIARPDDFLLDRFVGVNRRAKPVLSFFLCLSCFLKDLFQDLKKKKTYKQTNKLTVFHCTKYRSSLPPLKLRDEAARARARARVGDASITA